MTVIVVHALKTVQICKNNSNIFAAWPIIGTKLHNAVIHFVSVKNAGKQVHSTKNAEFIKHLIAGNFRSNKESGKLQSFFNMHSLCSIKVCSPDITHKLHSIFHWEKNKALYMSIHQRLIPDFIFFFDIGKVFRRF